MKIDLTFLRSKVALRIFSFFVISSILPIVFLATVSLVQVSHQLVAQYQKRLHQEATALGMSIFERLIYAETDMSTVLDPGSASDRTRQTTLHERFSGMTVFETNGGTTILFGEKIQIPVLNREQKDFLSAGGTLVFARQIGNSMGVCMCRSTGKDGRILISQVKTSYLIGMEEEEAAYERIKPTLLEGNSVVFTALTQGELLSLLRALDTSKQPTIEWAYGGDRYLAGAYSIFLKSRFHAPVWILVLSAAKSDIQATLETFKRTFILVTIITLFMVVFLSTNLIRRSLVPLEHLREGTRRIAQGDFTTQVRIHSHDEFEDLATSFNVMTVQVNQHFKTLNTLSDIDRAILSVLNIEKIVHIFLTSVASVIPCESAGLCLFDRSENEKDVWHNYRLENGSEIRVVGEILHLKQEEIQRIYVNTKYFLLGMEDEMPSYLHSHIRQGMQHFLMMPIFINYQLAAIAILTYKSPPWYTPNELLHARHLIDRLAVALTNAYLIKDLNLMNIGTITALARAVDAKSSWTAGHSERVSEMAIKIGTNMGLNPHELDILHKGGLLHDIGKINTPGQILDKPDKLSADEFRIVKEHPHYGARILEPLTPFAEMIPILFQHHERFDGKGYPLGLAESDIALSARIMAVADAFDAMTSDRPYRNGMQVEQALTIIAAEAGHQFDPAIVETFLQMMPKVKKGELT
jgi:putative nucleotidyltransferase with HDIG domain